MELQILRAVTPRLALAGNEKQKRTRNMAIAVVDLPIASQHQPINQHLNCHIKCSFCFASVLNTCLPTTFLSLINLCWVNELLAYLLLICLSSGCCNKNNMQTAWLKQYLFPTVLEAEESDTKALADSLSGFYGAVTSLCPCSVSDHSKDSSIRRLTNPT